MRKFQFQLESALTWRRQREQTVRARLEELAGRKAGLQQQRREVEARFLDAQAETLGRKSLASEELAALDGYRRASDMRQHAIDGELQTLEAAIAAQRAELVEAGRQTRLLEKLKDRRRAAWQREADVLLEQEASELYLAQWLQQRE